MYLWTTSAQVFCVFTDHDNILSHFSYSLCQNLFDVRSFSIYGDKKMSQFNEYMVYYEHQGCYGYYVSDSESKICMV